MVISSKTKLKTMALTQIPTVKTPRSINTTGISASQAEAGKLNV